MKMEKEDEIEMNRRLTSEWVRYDNKTTWSDINWGDITTTVKTPYVWSSDKDRIKKFENTDVNFKVVSGKVLELINAMKITTYEIGGVVFVSASDIDNIEDKV